MPGQPAELRHCHILRQIHILNRVEQRDAVLHRLLERLAPGDQAHAAGALVDDGGAHRLMQVVLFALLVRLPEFPGFALASADADIVLDDHPVHYAQSQ